MTAPAVAEEPRPAFEIAALWPPQGQWTEADFWRLPETSRTVELSAGVVSVKPSPGLTHQRVLDALYSALKHYVTLNKLGVTAFAPVAIRLWPGQIRAPDFVFFGRQSEDRIGEWVSGPPDLAAEIISPGTRRTDRHDKFFAYAQAGIGEYWLVDPAQQTIDVFVLDDGVYTVWMQADRTQRATSRLLDGFAVNAADIFPAH